MNINSLGGSMGSMMGGMGALGVTNTPISLG